MSRRRTGNKKEIDLSGRRRKSKGRRTELATEKGTCLTSETQSLNIAVCHIFTCFSADDQRDRDAQQRNSNFWEKGKREDTRGVPRKIPRMKNQKKETDGLRGGKV